MARKQSKPLPAWFVSGAPLMWTIAQRTYECLNKPTGGDLSYRYAALCAAIHYIHCLSLSVEVNRKGQHAVAICLVRQCVEALTVIEVGLLREKDLSVLLMKGWHDGAKTSGGIRKQLEEEVWPRYGTGLWGESWAEYFGSFCRAVQPYAHYSPELQGWQMAIIDGAVRKDSDGNYLLLSKIGLSNYDANKATRVTCLHCLLAWTLGRILTVNVSLPDLSGKISQLGKVLAAAEELYGGKIDWPTQFWAHEFTRPPEDSQPAATEAPGAARR